MCSETTVRQIICRDYAENLAGVSDLMREGKGGRFRFLDPFCCGMCGPQPVCTNDMDEEREEPQD